MVEGIPAGHRIGEVPLTTEHASLIVFAFEGTPYADIANEAQGEALGPVQDALWATVNIHHAQRVASSNARPDTSCELIMQGILGGNTNEEIIAGHRIATGLAPRPFAINHARKVVRGTLLDVSNKLAAHRPNASLPEYIEYANGLSGELMGGAKYPIEVPLHQAIQFFANSTNPHQADPGRSRFETQALMHHMSDDPNASPAVLPSAALDSALSNFRTRYRQWLEQSGHSHTSEAFQLMDTLLGLTGQRELQSFRQLLGTDPTHAPKLRELYMQHLNDMFVGFLEMPPVRQVTPEQARPSKTAKKVAAAAGPAAVDAAVVEDRATLPQAVKYVPKKAARAKKAAPAKAAAAGAKAAPAKAAASKATKPRAVGARRASDEEFDVAAAELLATEVDADVIAGEVRTEAEIAAAASMQGIFDFATPEDRRSALEEKITRDGTDIWVIAAETDDAYAPGQTGRAMSTDGVRGYLRQIGKTPLLNAEQEVELCTAIEAGVFAWERLYQAEQGLIRLSHTDRRDLLWVQRIGERARNLMLESNLRLVVSLAKRYTGKAGTMSFLDLIQEGNGGLMRAVDKFNYDKGYKFSTYATWWIRQSITRAIADQARTIRIPVHMVEVIRRVGKADRDLTADLGRAPTDDELAAELEITVEKLMEIRVNTREPVSLDRKVGEDSDTDLASFVGDEKAETAAHDSAVVASLHDAVRGLLGELRGREADAIRLRFGLDDGVPKTLEEIGTIWGVSRERVRQVETKAMLKLRKNAPDALKIYLH
jgi:RNA polymerase primary sigma factor